MNWLADAYPRLAALPRAGLLIQATPVEPLRDSPRVFSASASPSGVPRADAATAARGLRRYWN